MDKINNSGKWIVGAITVVVVVIGIVVLVLHGHGAGQMSASNSQSSTAADTSGGSPTSSAAIAPPSSSGGSNGSLAGQPAPVVHPASPALVINLLTPIANDQWVIGQQNTISWDAFPNITGQIDLLKASDRSLVGVIVSETEAHQTSYSWNTRSYNLGRYGGLMRDVVPGAYLVEVKFDGNNLPNLISGPITITN